MPGHIRLDGARGEARQAVRGGERVDLAPPPVPDATPRAQRMPLAIVHEDADLIVIDKPAGLVVHPGAGVPDRTLMNGLLAHAPALAGVPRAGIVHRLDKDTSGLLVVAKTVEAQVDLVRQLENRSMRRVYLAVVQGDPPTSGMIDAPVGRDARARTRMTVTRRGKDAVTRYRVLERYGHAALVECRLESGRTHQIRVHFQHIRHPRRRRRVPARHARPRLRAPGAARGGAVAPASAQRQDHDLAGGAAGRLPETVERPAAVIVPDWPAPARVRALVTTRGESAPPLPAAPAWLRQVHGVGVVDAAGVAGEPEADASIARVPGVVCAVKAADCMPVLLADEAGSVVALRTRAGAACAAV